MKDAIKAIVFVTILLMIIRTSYIKGQNSVENYSYNKLEPTLIPNECILTYGEEQIILNTTPEECNTLGDYTRHIAEQSRIEGTKNSQPVYIQQPAQNHYTNCMRYGNMTNCVGN